MAKQESNAKDSAELELLKAKIAFIKASKDVSPLNIVDRHPFVSLSVAFTVGYACRFLGWAARTAPPMLATLTALSGIAARIVPLFRRQ